MHKIITIGLINGVVKWLIAFPSMNEISKTMSPATIVQKLPKHNMKFKIIVLGLCTMTCTGTNNKMDTRSEPDIELNSSNEHGGHYFMFLYSDKCMHSCEWKELPIDEEVVSRVEELAKEEEAPEMKRGHPVFNYLDDPTLNINNAIECNTPIMNDGYEEEVNNKTQEEPMSDQEIAIEPNNDELIDVEEKEP